MNTSLQECHTVKNILDTRVILDGEVKEEMVMQEGNMRFSQVLYYSEPTICSPYLQQYMK